MQRSLEELVDALAPTSGAFDATVRIGTVATTPAAEDVTVEPFLPSITLAPLSAGKGRGATEVDLLLGAELGRGGMGVVYLGEQQALGRGVAVKRPAPATEQALITEARTMARVEHPNVVPVHALGRAGDGAPVLVMKRIDGVSLHALVHDPDDPAWRRLEARWGDRDSAYAGILAEVADALDLAHSRGVMHLDIKPDNVMVGEFGEVFLLDWGIARSIDAPLPARFSIVGTPGYMAPEMVVEPGRIDVRSDVYLLGATLHELLTGSVRHRGTTLHETLEAAVLSEPVVYPPEVPEDLAALANAATARDPDARPPTAAAVARALREHARHREALRLVDDARRALGPLAAGSIAAGDALASSRLTEARASLAAAERAYPESAVVRAAQSEWLGLAIERELALESPVAARALAAEYEELAPALEARIAAVEERVARAKASALELAIERKEADVASSLPMRVMIFLLALFGILVPSLWVAATGRLTQGGGSAMAPIVLTDWGGLIALVAGVVVFRRRLLATRASRTLTWYGLGAVASVAATNLVSLFRSAALDEGLLRAYLAIAVYLAAGALAAYPTFWPGAAVALAIAAAIHLQPAWTPVLAPIGLACVTAAAIYGVVAGARATKPGPK